MLVEERVGQLGLSQLGVGNRLTQPPVVRRATQTKHFEGDLGRHRSPRGLSRAGRTFPRQVRLQEIGRGAAQSLVLLFQAPDAASCFA